ncbi:MAG: hypothetical protein ACT4OO_00660 [Nitrospiraceae bacterium]
MTPATIKWLRQPFLRLLAVTAMLAVIWAAGDVRAADPIDYCANRAPDQQLGASLHPERKGKARSEPGCVPLVDKNTHAIGDEPDAAARPAKPRRTLKIENLQSEATTFLQKYRQFLACCKTDLNELATVEELGDEVADLLQMAQSELFSEQMKLRGWTLREIIPPVAKARGEIRDLRIQLEDIGRSMEKRGMLDYEAAGKETLAIQETEESIQKTFRPHKLPAGAKTGLDIGTTPSTGKEIGKTPTTGTRIGAEGLTGPEIGVNPKTGREIGSTGPTGFEIGVAPRAGPEVGESRLNSDPSAVNSTLQPSTVNSSLTDSTLKSTVTTPSTMGSSLQDSTIGSTLGGSSVGSSLQNRSTGPQ